MTGRRQLGLMSRWLIGLIPVIGVILSSSVVSALECPNTGPVIAKIEAFRVYSRNDPTYSIVDAAAYEKNRELVGPTRHFQAVISRLADASQSGSSELSRSCLHQILSTWARGNAFLSAPKAHQEILVLTWVLSTAALGVVKADMIDEVRADPQIMAWLEEFQARVVANVEARKTINNHNYWGALAVFVSGVILNRQDLIELADGWHTQALGNIDQDGYLSEELKRGARAYHYHYFAAQPLFVQERLRQLAFPRRAVPASLGRLLNMLSLSALPARFPVPQQPAKETGWMSIYCRQASCQQQFDAHEFIPRLAGRVDVLDATMQKLDTATPAVSLH